MVISGVVYSVGDWIAQVGLYNLFLGINESHSSPKPVIEMRLQNGLSPYPYYCSALRENLFLNLTGRVCSDQALLVLLYMALFLITTISFARLSYSLFLALLVSWSFLCMIIWWHAKLLLHSTRSYFLSKSGGSFLPKLPLIKLHGQQFGTAFIIQLWGFCALILQSVFLVNWRQHLFPC